MLVNDEYTADRDRRTGRAKGWKGPERRLIAPEAGGQLLEQGDHPTGAAAAAQAGSGELTTQGDADDAPRYGDWVRHSTGTTSGARGHEGEDFPGEHTWGEEQAERERRESGPDRRKNRQNDG